MGRTAQRCARDAPLRVVRTPALQLLTPAHVPWRAGRRVRGVVGRGRGLLQRV